jgi:endonuclease-3 related protein
MPSLYEVFPRVVVALKERYGGPPDVPKSGGPEATVIAAVIEHFFSPRHVDPALKALRDAGLADPKALAEADPVEVAEVFKTAGISTTLKVVRLIRSLGGWVADRATDKEWTEVATKTLREELLRIRGVGRVLADTTLLSGLNRPVYPVDHGSFRILVRHGWIDPSTDYEDARDVLERPAAEEPRVLRRLADWFEQVARAYCRVSVAKCERCPLKPFLPQGGPLGADH